MLFLILFSLLGSAEAQTQLVPAPRVPRKPVEQPLPFSHKTHTATAGLPCKQCHSMPEPGDFATTPATTVCMGCHQSVKKESPHIAKLAALHNEGKRPAWRPVYRIPDWVSFSHKKHTAVAGVTCETCHGAVAQRDVLARERDLGMQACMECHRAKNASNDCIVCHDPR